MATLANVGKRFLTKIAPSLRVGSVRTLYSVGEHCPEKTGIDDHNLEVTKESHAETHVEEITTIAIEDKMDITAISGVPEEHRKTRMARIFVPARNAMQSGSYGTRNWKIEFDQRERWENPLMGWISTADPLSTLNVDFNTLDQAQQFCDKNGWEYFVEKPHVPTFKKKNYGDNYSWNKRTRKSTK